MANFLNLKEIKVKNSDFSDNEYEEKYNFLFSGDWYKVDGELTNDDIYNINQLNKETYLVFENTKNLKIDVLKQIDNHNIKFSIVGGNDYINKDKFMKSAYLKRTIIEKEHLIAIIEYFERIEKHINKDWNETQKCMFLYDCIVKDFNYGNNYNSIFKNGIEPERGLNGILYKKLVCAGFAQVFKEGLDRLDIKNYYQNKKGVHDWNIVKLDGAFTGMDITWDCYNKGNYNINNWKWFGCGNDFYDHEEHQNFNIIQKRVDGNIIDIKELNPDELSFNLCQISPETLKANFDVIKPEINNRKVENKPILAVEKFKDIAEKENSYIILFEYLKTQNILTESELLEFNNIYSKRKALIRDIVGNNKQFVSGDEIGLFDLKEVELHTNGAIITPFGNNIPRINIYNLSLEKLKEINNLLKERMRVYSNDILKSCMKDLEKDVQKYIELSKIERTESQSIIYANIYSKLDILLSSKKNLIEMGIDNNLINNMESIIEKALSMNSVSKEQYEKIQTKNDIDYLCAILNDYDGLKNLAEQYYGKAFTDQEWLDNFKSYKFMKETFNEGLSQFSITDEQLQEVLDNIVKEKELNSRIYN